MGIRIAAAIMMTGTGTSAAAALAVIQEIARPSVLSDQSLIPLGLAGAVLLATVGATIRVVRWIDRINREVQELKDILSVKGEDGDGA